jgi:hypothetical protein
MAPSVKFGLTEPLQSGRWASLGDVQHANPGTSSVTLTDVTGDDAQGVRFDAVMWVPRYDTMPPASWIQKLRRWTAVPISFTGVVTTMSVALVHLMSNIGSMVAIGVNWQNGTGASEALFTPPATVSSSSEPVRVTGWAKKPHGVKIPSQ